MIRAVRAFLREVLRQAALQTEAPRLPAGYKDAMMRIVWAMAEPYEGPEDPIEEEEAMMEKAAAMREARPAWKKAVEQCALAAMRLGERFNRFTAMLWRKMRERKP